MASGLLLELFVFVSFLVQMIQATRWNGYIFLFLPRMMLSDIF